MTNRHTSCLITFLSKGSGLSPKEWLEGYLDKFDWSITHTADKLGVSDEVIRSGARRHGLDVSRLIYRRRARKGQAVAHRVAHLGRYGFKIGQDKEFLQFWADKGYSCHLAATYIPMPRTTLVRWAKEFGVVFNARTPGHLHKERPIQKARAGQAAKLSRKITWQGKVYTLSELSRLTGISRCGLAYRIKHWGVDKALTAQRDLKRGGRPGTAVGTLTPSQE